jgi:membrane fusion protein (multidrug efflux system)
VNRQRCPTLCLLLGLWLAGNPALAEPRAQVQTEPLTRHSLSETITVYGHVQPDPEHINSIALPRAGMIDRLLVRLGQRVSADQELLELATAPQAQMDYEKAKAAVDYARSNLEQKQRLLSQQLATHDQVASARRDLQDAEAKLQALLKLGNQHKREIIRAPFSGIITELKVSQGQRVQADSTAMLLASGDTLIVPLGVEPEDARRIRPGMKVVLESLFQQQWHVQVEVTDVLAKVNPRTRLLEVLTRVPASKSAPLVLGDRIQGTITLHQETTLAAPRSAILRDKNGSYLFVVEKGRAHRVKVTTGLQQQELVAIQGSLHVGDAVVTLGNYELEEGMAVQEVKP